MPILHALGRRAPRDWRHVERYPLRQLRTPLPVPDVVNRTLKLPNLRDLYNQGVEGACVGFALSWMMSILNGGLAYDARRLYRQAQHVDEWPDTPPEEGTSVRAGCDVLRTEGHSRRVRGRTEPPLPQHGISENRWATTVDEVRACIHAGIPVTLGVNWYVNFDSPVSDRGTRWIGRGDLGAIRGGHAICCYAASDRRQAVKLVNSWGRRYPLVWLPYQTLDRLLREAGEATIVTDRV